MDMFLKSCMRFKSPNHIRKKIKIKYESFASLGLRRGPYVGVEWDVIQEAKICLSFTKRAENKFSSFEL